jgi:alpha,alpha-trehalose phosphorylase
VILQDAFTVEPWKLRETHLDLGWWANLDESEPHRLPGSYLNGVWESRPLSYAESAYGLPETGSGFARSGWCRSPSARSRRSAMR